MRNLFLFFGALGLLLGCQPALAGEAVKCGDKPDLLQSQRQAMARAEKLMAKDNKQAGRILAEYAQKHPKATHPDFSFLRGVIAYQDKKLAEAERHFSRAVDIWPCHVAALRNLAVTAYELGEPARAARLMLKAHENDEKSQLEHLYQAAAFYQAAGQASQALPLLEKLARNHDAKPEWLKALVRANMELKRYQKAEAALKPLLEQHPADDSLWTLSAWLNLEQENYDKAAADLEVAYRLSPPPAAKWRGLADLYRLAGVPHKAARYFRRAFGRKPKAKEWDILAEVYLEANDMDKALQAGNASLKQEPTVRRWRFLAQVYMRDKQYKEALRAYQSAARLSPKDVHLKLMAGYCAVQMEDYQQALDQLSQAAAVAKPKSAEAREAQRHLESIKHYLENDNQG